MNSIWQEALGIAVKNGLWAVLFLALLVYQLRDSKSREIKYQQTIDKLSTNLNFVKSINENVLIIKNQISDLTIKIVKIDKAVKRVSGDVKLIFQLKPDATMCRAKGLSNCEPFVKQATKMRKKTNEIKLPENCDTPFVFAVENIN